MIELMNHQKQIVELAKERDNLALLWEMGTGKTMATIKILEQKYEHYGRIVPTLILAPPIVLSNWKREFKVFSNLDDADIIILNGTGKKRAKLLQYYLDNSISPILITNYESMQMNEVHRLLMAMNIKILVCDESHRCKKHNGKRAKRVVQLADRAIHKYILTGTPMLNNALDLFMQYRILDGGETFGSNYYRFQYQYFEDANASWSHQQHHFPKYVPRADTYEIFAAKISNTATRIKKSECLDLPPSYPYKYYSRFIA